MAAAKALSEAQLLTAISKPDTYRLFLIFGPDESAAHSIANNLSTKMIDMERVELDGDTLKTDPALLADEASSQSLFGDKRYIRLSLKRDEAIGAIENLLDIEKAENTVIATAGNLTKASKLRKLAEKSPHIAFHICYQPGERELIPLLIDNAKINGLRLDRALASNIAKTCNYNRTLALLEIEKLSLFYDSRDNEMDLVDVLTEDFTKLSVDTSADNQGDLINALLSGNINKSGIEIQQAREVGLNAISIIRAMQRRITLLASMRTRVDAGMRSADVVKKTPSVFWKEENIVSVQLSTWTSTRLASLITHLLKIESNIMAAKDDFSDILLEQELMRICRAAAKTRNINR